MRDHFDSTFRENKRVFSPRKIGHDSGGKLERKKRPENTCNIEISKKFKQRLFRSKLKTGLVTQFSVRDSIKSRKNLTAPVLGTREDC